MNASPNEVQMILAAIDRVDRKVDRVKTDVADARTDMATMDRRINGRIRTLEKFRWQLIAVGSLIVASINLAIRFF